MLCGQWGSTLTASTTNPLVHETRLSRRQRAVLRRLASGCRAGAAMGAEELRVVELTLRLRGSATQPVIVRAATTPRAIGLGGIRLVPDVTTGKRPTGIILPEKDWPILLSAIRAKATHLLTGDRRHFGTLYGQTIGGVTVLRPADFLAH